MSKHPWSRLLPGIILAVIILSGRILALPNYIDSITVDSLRLRLDSVAAVYPFSCRSPVPDSLLPADCDTLELSSRLWNFACWQVYAGRTVPKILKELIDRERFFRAVDTVVSIAPSPLPSAGDPAAPVHVTVYVGGACSICKRTSIPLYDSVTRGALKGIAELTLKPAGREDADPALVAAAALGDFWEYYRSFGQIFKEIDVRLILDVADQMGYERRAFKNLMESDSLKTIAWNSRREALRNGMEYTPAIFINGRYYGSSSHPQWITEAALWEFRRMKHCSEKH